VGGATLAYIFRTLKYGCSVAASGLTGGTGFSTTVMPFILRGVNLLGIDSVQTPIEARKAMWSRIATDLKPTWLESQSFEIVGLSELNEQLDKILAGKMRGRVLVNPHL
jgi:NADPH:quinone reductase-like Zn-dependent oxidoreductase